MYIYIFFFENQNKEDAFFDRSPYFSCKYKKDEWILVNHICYPLEQALVMVFHRSGNFLRDEPYDREGNGKKISEFNAGLSRAVLLGFLVILK